MILHASVTADDPRATAETIAVLMGGEAFPFPDFGNNAWVAMAGDTHGTLVEVLERGTEFHYAADRPVAHRQGTPARESAFHILIESPLVEAEILEMPRSRGCRAHKTKHGPLEIIEVWFEDCLLIEVATPPMVAAYRNLATISNVRAMSGTSNQGHQHASPAAALLERNTPISA